MAQVIIFDMDGTLVDTNRMTARAMAELAPGYGLPVPSPEAVRSAIGLADLFFYRKLFPGYPDEALAPLSAVVEKREGELAREIGPAVLFPGVPEMLRALRAAGRRLYLASTGTRQHVRDMLGPADGEAYFDGIRCAQPDKEGMTAEILAMEPGRTAVFVGDTAKDVAAARANGLTVYGAGFGYVKAQERALFDEMFPSAEALLARLLEP